MRTINSLKNVIIAMVCNTITLLINFFTQKLFISNLGIEYSGLNSVFSNIISMLSITELGIGTAIIYHLYKPISETDINKIKPLMHFYKKAYRIIAFVVFIIGIMILPFINKFVDSSIITENVYIVYLLFLMDSVISYTATYKRSIIYANQKNRIVDLIHLEYVVVMNFVQILILIYLKNYILFLLIKVVCRIIENIIISIVANKMYPFLLDKTNRKIDDSTKKDIVKKVKAQIFHCIGGYIVLGTDNILISKFLGLSIAGMYGNYMLIVNAANTILSQIFNAITASVGNLIIENDYNNSYKVYKRINFFNFFIYGLVATVFYFAINDFILIWLNNSEFIFSDIVILLFSINLYMQGMRKTMQVFATAAGICHENRFVPLIEASINIIVSIIMLKYFGIIGVILGTIVSTFVLYFYSFPKYIYSPLFNKQKINYIKEFISLTIVAISNFIINFIINEFIVINNLYISFVVHTSVCILITMIFYYLVFKRDEYFLYAKNMIAERFNKLRWKNG